MVVGLPYLGKILMENCPLTLRPPMPIIMDSYQHKGLDHPLRDMATLQHHKQVGLFRVCGELTNLHLTLSLNQTSIRFLTRWEVVEIKRSTLEPTLKKLFLK